ncbi:hypothetical protein NE237_008230 [Protea cynaroides]|uniref:Transmembrane protein n=1 Tax=Protea cynaroides TaxID=273540 RepID=A0A9Q0KQX1_9MAGN|nr:hypothetical protein NE237_008230 [Protea cynaroides]
MASISGRFLIGFIFLGLLAIGTNARPGVHFHPCKTLFISYTISSIKSPLSEDPNNPNPSGFLTVFSEIREFNPRIILPSGPSVEFIAHGGRPDLRHPIRYSHGNDVVKPDIGRPPYPFGFFGIGSLRERTKDILSVVVALLFGVVCGALTSATIDYDVKKMGYVKIPDDPVAAPVKEVFLEAILSVDQEEFLRFAGDAKAMFDYRGVGGRCATLRDFLISNSSQH